MITFGRFGHIEDKKEEKKKIFRKSKSINV